MRNYTLNIRLAAVMVAPLLWPAGATTPEAAPPTPHSRLQGRSGSGSFHR